MNWLDYLPHVVGIITIIGSVAGLLRWYISPLQKDINRLDADVRACVARIDAQSLRMDQLGMRLDQVYGVIIDMLKDHKKK